MQLEDTNKSSEQQQIEGRWSPQEHQLFLEAIMAHGKNWKLIESVVSSRTTSQVRSHAQKFFLKLHKFEKDRKKCLKKGISDACRGDEELVQSLSQILITSNTPPQILHFLGRGKQQKPKQKDIQEEKDQNRSITQRILEEMMGSNEESSFLVSLMYRIRQYSRQNIDFFRREEDFTDLIDLPHIHRDQKEQQQTSNKRKKSFLLYQEEVDEQKYNAMVKKMKGQ